MLGNGWSSATQALSLVRSWTLGSIGWVIAVGMVLVGCGAKQSPSVQPAPLQMPPGEQVLPGAGLRWFARVDVERLLISKRFGDALAKLVPPRRLALYRQLNGFDPARASRVLIAKYPRSMLVVFEGVPVKPVLEKHRQRLNRSRPDRVFRHDVRIVEGTTVGGQLRSMAMLGDAAFALELGGTRRAEVATLLAMGKLRKTPRVLDFSDISLLYRAMGESTGARVRPPPGDGGRSELADAPVRMVVLGPFEGEWARGLRGLLGASTAVAVSVAFDRSGEARAQLLLAGDWQADRSRATKILLQAWEDVRGSDLGETLGLGVAVPLPMGDKGVIGFSTRFDAPRFVDGLAIALEANLGQVMEHFERAM